MQGQLTFCVLFVLPGRCSEPTSAPCQMRSDTNERPPAAALKCRPIVID
jgi:hypothetical protein